MLNRKPTHESGSFSSLDYRLPGYEAEAPKKSKSTLRKWGERVVAAATLGAAGFGLIEAVSHSVESDRKEAVAVGEEFKKAIEPAAQELAEAAKKGYEASKKDGYMLEDRDDPTKHNLSFRHTFEDGSSYNITATIGENDKGEADTSKVERAEITRMSAGDTQTSMITFELEDDVMDGQSQWVASSGVATKGMRGQAVTTEYHGGTYENKDQSVEFAKEFAADASKELAEIAKKTQSDLEKPAA